MRMPSAAAFYPADSSTRSLRYQFCCGKLYRLITANYHGNGKSTFR
ncbi:MAG: hypothetical protein IPN95_25205 [Bacteroidetes bacterium]|nr:hypothetical protein [Bacteroidota bacterium]